MMPDDILKLGRRNHCIRVMRDECEHGNPACDCEECAVLDEFEAAEADLGYRGAA